MLRGRIARWSLAVRPGLRAGIRAGLRSGARWLRSWPWVALVLLLVVVQAVLWALTLRHERQRAQEQVDVEAAAAASDLAHALSEQVYRLLALTWQEDGPAAWRAAAQALLRERHALMRIEQRNGDFLRTAVLTSPYHPGSPPPAGRLDSEVLAACQQALRQRTPWFSRSYFVPRDDGGGQEVADVCMPWSLADGDTGVLLATVGLATALEHHVAAELLRGHEVSLVEPDGTRLARGGNGRGGGRYVAERLVALPGLRLPLRVDSMATGPHLIPTVSTALVLALSLALALAMVLLGRDARRRTAAERRLAEALAFRKAMEDSVLTGLRARDMNGHTTYVNAAFCQMVGFRPGELIGRLEPPYWPPGTSADRPPSPGARPPGDGVECIYMRRDGERFPVRIFEAPLVDGHGQQTGWMSAVLDMGEQRRGEERSRQQQERLQATARLATLGEMASLLSHELNQPLAAIASYATGTLNIMPADGREAAPDAPTLQMIRQATERIAEQAERAGRVIKSVHDFVRRRSQAHETVTLDQLVESVLPLVRLAARKSGATLEVDLARPVVSVLGDRTMLEQVILNLARNAIQAMEEVTPPQRRHLVMRAQRLEPRRVGFVVIDQGPGITPEVAQRLFTPFFTTKPDGMGLGLSLCRTVIEQHGGTLSYRSPLGPQGGTEFQFTLPTRAAAAALEAA